MPISNNDRLDIYNYITSANTLCNHIARRQYGGPCGSFVQSVIEFATQKKILNPNHVFNVYSNQIVNKTQIKSFFQFNQLKTGDVLCIIDKKKKETNKCNDLVHYVLFLSVNYNGNHFHVISFNEIKKKTSLQFSIDYKGAKLSEIKFDNFECNYTWKNPLNGEFEYIGDVFWYENKKRLCELYKVDYEFQ